jgi:transcriptional/translational regulatory protein YebC/TACO1
MRGIETIMSGHLPWAGIKRKKEITNKKRRRIFSKSLKLISAAAATEPNPAFNPRLRTVQEIKTILPDNKEKWAFESGDGEWNAKFPQDLTKKTESHRPS